MELGKIVRSRGKVVGDLGKIVRTLGKTELMFRKKVRSQKQKIPTTKFVAGILFYSKTDSRDS